MLIQDLFETASDDARRSQNADTVFQQAMSFLYKAKDNGTVLPTAVYEGKDVPCLPAEDFDALPLFHDILFIFKPSEYAMNGKAIKVKDKIGGRYQYIVVIDVEGTTVPEIIKSLRYSRVEQVVRHELQHILDFKRYRGNIFKSREPNFKDGPKDAASYHNSSAELNAYFHNSAEPLLKRIRFMQKHGAHMVGIFDDLPDTFREYVKEHLPKYGANKRHIDSLTPVNKRKFLARLSKLFDLYMQIKSTSATRDHKIFNMANDYLVKSTSAPSENSDTLDQM